MPIHLLRYDDYSAISSPAMERPFFEMIAHLRYACTVAVVPFVLDAQTFCGRGKLNLLRLPPEKVGVLKELIAEGLVEVALHGWSHLALSPLREMAEFSDGMPLDVQRRLLREGRAYLEDVFQTGIVTFVPPWNRLGRTTIEALKQEGLSNVSGGYPSPFDPCYPLGEEAAAPLRNVPCWLSVQETAKALGRAARWGGEQSVVGTLIHDYDFYESGYGVARLSIAALREHLTVWSACESVDKELIRTAAELQGVNGWRRARQHVDLMSRCCSGFLGRRYWRWFAGTVYWDERDMPWLKAVCAGFGKL